MFLEISQSSQENTCARVSFLIKLQVSGPQACNFIKIEALAQIFSGEFCEISKNTSFTEHLSATVSMLFNPLSTNITKWPNTPKQFVGKFSMNCLRVFDHFVGLALKGLKICHFAWDIDMFWSIILEDKLKAPWQNGWQN